MEDINGDGQPDLITGKRYFAHNGGDSGGYEPAVLYWFEYKTGKIPQWIPHLIESNSGVGLTIVVKDINKDKRRTSLFPTKKECSFLNS